MSASSSLDMSPPLKSARFQKLSLELGVLILALMVGAALLAPVLPLLPPEETNLLRRSLPPIGVEGWMHEHWLGTDALGRDVLSRLVHGARTSLAIGFGVTAVSALIGVSLGLAAGYFGGPVDTAISFLITARLAMPVILVALASVAIFGSSLTTVLVVLGTLLWDRFALVARAMTRRVCEADFIAAAKIQGTPTLRIVRIEVLPNIANSLIVVATLEVGLAIVLEAALSFLGMGVPAPTASWGLMISEGKADLLFNPWLVVVPSIALFGLVMSINLIGDALQSQTGERAA